MSTSTISAANFMFAPPPDREKAPAPGLTDARGGNQGHGKPTTTGTVGKVNFDREQLEAMRGRLAEYLAACGLELRPHGARLVGKCPMHEDRTPSFAVFPGGQGCGCYPCSFTGDVFKVAEWLGRAGNFVEAVQDVAAVLGVHLSQRHAQRPPRQRQAQPRPAREPEPPFELSEADREKIRDARLAFCDAFHAGESVIDEIAADLGLSRETLRLGAWGRSGLGLVNGWLAYAYPSGLKTRNRNPQTKPRFLWAIGKPAVLWRAEWIKPETRTVYLTEGESDALALIGAGAESDGSAVCVASPGTSFSSDWAPLFKGKRVILCFDSDTAGQTAVARVAGLLKGYAAAISTWKGPRQ